jgi:cytochrome c oxidase assembly factor CtaG
MPHSQRAFDAAMLVLTACVAWPLGDLAAHVSLTAAAAQRLIIVLGVGPLLWRSLPLDVVIRLTSPRPIDWLASTVARPAIAMAVTTMLGAVTLTPSMVAWSSHAALGRLSIIGLSVLAGLVLWLPVMGQVPGARHLSSAGKGAYLFASALVVTSVSFVWLFARHSLYPSLRHTQAITGLTPLADQQLAAVVAKLGAFFVLWAVAGRIFFRDADTEREGDQPLYVADIERHALRARRRVQRERGLN